MKHQISKVGKEMLALQERLAKEYGYKPIEPNLFTEDVREIFKRNLPDWCDERGEEHKLLYSLNGTLLATGYQRIVIGDYGAFVEISCDQIQHSNIRCKPGEEYRLNDSRFSKNVKYHWLTVPDGSNCKVYYQQKTVSYADYIPGMYYVSPYEVYVI